MTGEGSLLSLKVYNSALIDRLRIALIVDISVRVSSGNISRWGTVDAEIKMYSAVTPALSNVFSFQPGVRHHVASYALSTGTNPAVLFSALLVHLTTFPPTLL